MALVIVGLFLCFLLLSPVWIPFVVVLTALEERRKTAIASRFPCKNCGAMLGKRSLRRAQQENEIERRRWERENPGMRVPVDLERMTAAICCACDQTYTFREKENTFRLQEKRIRPVLGAEIIDESSLPLLISPVHDVERSLAKKP